MRRLKPKFGRPFIVIAFAAICLASCSSSNDEVEDNGDNAKFANDVVSHRVVAVSYPLVYLTRRIVGDSVTVEFAGEGVGDPKNWNPSIEEMASLQSADLVVANGPGAVYADWLVRVSLSDSKMCRSCRFLRTRSFVSVDDYRVVHNHGPKGEHSHPFMVAYTWLDPEIARQQAAAIADRLASIYPAQADSFKKAQRELNEDLEQLSTRIARLKKKQLDVISAVPSFKFLTRAAEISDTHMLWFENPEIENWESVSEKFTQRTTDISANVILWAAEPDADIAKKLQSLGYDSVVLDLMDRAPINGDYLTVMQSNIEKLEAIESNANRAKNGPTD